MHAETASPIRHTTTDVLLVWPPAYYPWCTPAGLAHLAGVLQHQGCDVHIIDANVGALEHVLLRGCATESSPVQVALDRLRNLDDFDDWQTYELAASTLSAAATAVSRSSIESLVYERNTVRYRPAFDSRTRAGLLAAARQPDIHLFAAYYRDCLIPEIQARRPKLLGFSASDLHQLLPVTVLAALCRELLLDDCPPIVVGGNVFSRIAKALSRDEPLNHELFQIWGRVIVGEAEQSLLQLARSASGQFGTVNSPMPGELRPGHPIEAKLEPTNLQQLPPPRVDGFRPILPRQAYPLNIYRGCWYAGVCNFCDINQGYDTVLSNPRGKLTKSARRLRRIDLVLDDVRKAIEVYDTRIFSFTDEWFRAAEMLEFADAVVEQELDIAWDAYARFERSLANPEVAQRLRRGGLRFLQFGLETASISTLKTIAKGTSPESAARVLHSLTAAGIWNHVFVIIGLPGESIHEMMLTLAFLVQHAHAIFTIKPTRFNLSSTSPYARGIGQPSVEVNIEQAQRQDIALNIPFNYSMVYECDRCKRRYSRQLGYCSGCQDRLKPRRVLSHRNVNLVYDIFEYATQQHWAYPFTSLYPYQARLFVSAEEAHSIAFERRASLHGQRCRTDLLDGLRRLLERERSFQPHIHNIYVTSGIELPRKFQSWGELLDFVNQWSDAVSHVRPGYSTSPPYHAMLEAKHV